MAKIEAAIRDAIARGARRQIRVATGSLRREVRRLRQVVRQLRRDVAGMRDVATQWQRAARTTPWKPDVSERELRGSRLSARLIRKLRIRLGLSQLALARLVGVSAGAVVQWERGRSSPTAQNRSQLIGLRKLGRRDVKRLLAAVPGKSPRPRGPRRRRRRRTRASRKRR